MLARSYIFLLRSAYYWSALFSSMPLNIQPDKTVPYPDSLEPEAASTLRENMDIAGNTAALLGGLREQLGLEDEGAVGDGALTDDGVPASSDEDQAKADEIFKAFAQKAKQQFEEAMAPEPDVPAKRGRGRPRKYPLADKTPANPPQLYQGNVAQRIRTMLDEYNAETVADAAELRQVVTNKLLDLSMCGDPKIEIKAAEMLGKISDVGLFTEKTEITVNYNSVSDLDQAIKDKVRKMLTAHAVDIAPIELDIDKELGDVPLVEDVTPAQSAQAVADNGQEPALPAPDAPDES